MTLKMTYSSKSWIKIKATELVNFYFSCKKWHWKGHTRQNLKLKSKPLNCTLKIHFGNVHAAQSNLLIHVVLIVNLKYENALYKLIQAPMITSIFFLNVAVFYYAKKQKYCNKTNQFSLKKKIHIYTKSTNLIVINACSTSKDLYQLDTQEMSLIDLIYIMYRCSYTIRIYISYLKYVS